MDGKAKKSLFHKVAQDLIRKITDIYTGGTSVPEVTAYDGDERIVVYQNGHVRRGNVSQLFDQLTPGAQTESFTITDGVEGDIDDQTLFYGRVPYDFEMLTGIAEVDVTPDATATIEVFLDGESMAVIEIENLATEGELVFSDENIFTTGGILKITASDFAGASNLRYTLYGERV